MKRVRNAKRAGFTLVELLVVIGIIALLIAILMPALSKARAAANNAMCLSNLKELYMGVAFYANDNQGVFPAARGGTSYQTPIPRKLGRSDEWGVYIKSPKVWACPSDLTDQQTTAAVPGMYSNQQLGALPNISYAYNQTCGMLDNQTGATNGKAWYFNAYKPSNSKVTSYEPIFFDVECGSETGSPYTWWYQWGRIDLTTGFNSAQTGSQYYSGRHNGYVNVVAADGHAEGIDIAGIVKRMVPRAQHPQNWSENAQVRNMLLPWQTYVTGSTPVTQRGY